jgi:hypothetical protein
MMPIDPWASKESLKWFLLKLTEAQELDALIKDYIGNILGQKIVMSPSKGPYGEKGKDIVAIENEDTGAYCSYVIKRGTLREKLDGPYGILKQMRDAMMIDLEIEKYHGKQRTVVVVHNGDEGYRGAINKFEMERSKVESEINGILLLRPIERWDIEDITDRLFPHQQYFKDSEINRIILDRLYHFEDIVMDFHNRAKTIISKPEKKTGEIKQHFMEHFDKIENIQQNYSFDQINRETINE